MRLTIKGTVLSRLVYHHEYHSIHVVDLNLYDLVLYLGNLCWSQTIESATYVFNVQLSCYTVSCFAPRSVSHAPKEEGPARR